MSDSWDPMICSLPGSSVLEISREVVRFIKTESRMMLARSSGGGEWGVIV